MRYNKDKYHISTLIYKAIIKTMSEVEEKELNKWLEDGDNRTLYNRVISVDNIRTTRAIYNVVDQGTSYEKLQKRIQEKERNRRVLYFYKYAAAILLLVVGGYIIFQETTRIQKDDTEEIMTSITPGYEKATLVLADGTEIKLEKNQNKVIQSTAFTQIENKDNLLTYHVGGDKDSRDEVLYNTLYVPVGGIYQVQLPDGSRVWLNSSSSLKYPEAFNKDKRIVTLEGEAYFEVVKGEKEFIVKTESRDITVLGTSFNVCSYQDDAFFATTLVEGKVKLTKSDNGTNVAYLAPGERVFLDKEGKEGLVLEKTDTKIHTSWKDGKFYFEKESLENILKKASRWYGFDVAFDDLTLKNETFTGVVPKDYPIQRVLNLISKSSKIDYKITKMNDRPEVKIFKKE